MVHYIFITDFCIIPGEHFGDTYVPNFLYSFSLLLKYTFAWPSSLLACLLDPSPLTRGLGFCFHLSPFCFTKFLLQLLTLINSWGYDSHSHLGILENPKGALGVGQFGWFPNLVLKDLYACVVSIPSMEPFTHKIICAPKLLWK